MHEMSVATGIINVLQSKLNDLDPCKLTAMDISIGQLAGIDESSLSFCLDTLLAERGFEPVQVRFESAPALFKCSACTWQGTPEDFTVKCPSCSQGELEIIGGRDVTLERIEVE